MRRGKFVRQLVVSGAVLLLPVMGYAQEATLSGTVRDITGGVLPGVMVQAVHEATGNSFEAVTDGTGAYRLAVRVGVYRVTAQLQGFATVTHTGVELLVGQRAVVNLDMSPATLEEMVTVSGAAPLIDVTSSRVAGNIDPRQLQELPVQGRNWIDLTMLAPGSRSNAVAETPITSTGRTVNFQLNLDGQRVTNNMAVDWGQPRYSRDAIAEFEFVSNRFDASQGHSSGVQVNVITKSGTNRFAGLGSGYFRSDKFNAADHVVGKVLPYSNQQISTTFGGPIQRDRFHFFVSSEYEREPQTFTYTTPYPRFNTSLTGTRVEFKELARLDYQFSPGTRLSLRGARYDNRIPYDWRYTGGGTRTAASAIGTNRRSEQLLVTLTQVVLSGGAVNEIKAGHDVFHWNQFPHAGNAKSLVGMTAGLGAPVIQLQGFTLGQSHLLTPQDIGEQEYSLRDDFSTSFAKGGRHNLKAGGEYIYNLLFETVCNNCMGIYDARGGPVPANIEDLIPDVMDVTTWNLDALSRITRSYYRGIAMAASPYSRPAGGSGFTEYAPRHTYAFWVQDDWQVSTPLTLNLGLRYDLSLDQFVNWVIYPPFLTSPRPQDKNNLSPRVGFAYSLTDQTLLRGGFGKYYAEVTSQNSFTLRTVQQISPLVLNDGRPDFASNPFNGPAPTYEEAATRLCSVSRTATCLRPNIGNMVAVDLEQPYSYQGSVGVARQLGPEMSFEADYIFRGDRATLRSPNMNIAYNPSTGANYPFVGARADVNKRVYPDYGTIGLSRSDGKTNTHSLQTSFTKRMNNGWQASATYSLEGVWEFDNYPLHPSCQYPMTITGTAAPRCDVPITLAPDIAENKWYLTGAQRHRFTFNGIWDPGHDFQVSGLYIYGDEGWLTPNSGVDVRQSGGGGSRLRPDGTVIERRSFDKPSLHRVDLRVQRRFKLGGSAAVEGIFEVFNVFNRANYESFVMNENSRNFGQPQAHTNIAYAPRVLQLGFRTTF